MTPRLPLIEMMREPPPAAAVSAASATGAREGAGAEPVDDTQNRHVVVTNTIIQCRPEADSMPSEHHDPHHPLQIGSGGAATGSTNVRVNQLMLSAAAAPPVMTNTAVTYYHPLPIEPSIHADHAAGPDLRHIISDDATDQPLPQKSVPNLSSCCSNNCSQQLSNHNLQQPKSRSIAVGTMPPQQQQQRQSDSSSNSTSSATHCSNNNVNYNGPNNAVDRNNNHLWRLQLPCSGSTDPQLPSSTADYGRIWMSVNHDHHSSSSSSSCWASMAAATADDDHKMESRRSFRRMECVTAGDEFVAATTTEEDGDDHHSDLKLHDMKAQIMAHPVYPRLLSAYINCRKFGAPPEVARHLEEVSEKAQLQLIDNPSGFDCYVRHQLINNIDGRGQQMLQEYQKGRRAAAADGHLKVDDEELDKFMNAYADLLQRYYQELTSPFYTAMAFLQSVEAQLSLILGGCNYAAAAAAAQSANNYSGAAANSSSADRNPASSLDINVVQMVKAAAAVKDDGCGSEEELEMEEEEEEEEEANLMMMMMGSGEVDSEDVDPMVEDQKLKQKLLHKYRGHIQVLRQQFMRKRKKGKLPKESRQKLLEWWNQHYKWPYPTEAEKTTLAEASGLDPKQINNWFINQRKRHWKPSEDMKFHVLVPDSESTINMNNAPDSITNIPAYY